MKNGLKKRKKTYRLIGRVIYGDRSLLNIQLGWTYLHIETRECVYKLVSHLPNHLEGPKINQIFKLGQGYMQQNVAVFHVKTTRMKGKTSPGGK